MKLSLPQRAVLRLLAKGALLLDGRGVPGKGVYLSFGPARHMPLRPQVFEELREAGYISQVATSRMPPRWRASPAGQHALERALEARKTESRKPLR